MIKSCAFAAMAAASIWSIVASGAPQEMFFAMVPEKSQKKKVSGIAVQKKAEIMMDTIKWEILTYQEREMALD